MILYIIRHADPDYEHNTITPFGWEEAHALARLLKDVKLDHIYSSPLGRAIDTATPTCKVKGMEPTILPWTAESMDYMESNKLTPDHTASYRFSVQKGVYEYEDFADSDRMKTVENMIACSDEFLASHGYVRDGLFYRVNEHNDKSLAVFCHGGFAGAWITHLLGGAPALAFPTVSLGTSSVTTFRFRKTENGYTRPVLERLGEIRHIYDAGLRINNR